MAKLSTILDQIDAGTMQLPEFQRGYVWNRDQVRGLMRSLYHGYPVGALLVWETEGSAQAVRGAASSAGQKQLLLDGQQRVTTLYGIIRGKAPGFFEGDPSVFAGLRFNVEDESFQFHAPVKMKDDPLWIDVTAMFAGDDGAAYEQLLDLKWLRPKLPTYLARISQLQAVLQRDFHIEQITGADKTVDVVVDIFNRVNSGGTKLSKGDLALARICSDWADARPTMRRNIERWKESGFSFTPDWLLRNANAVATGRAPFSVLEDVSADQFEVGLNSAVEHVDHLLYLITTRLGLDHDRVLMGRYALPVLSRHLANRGGRFVDGAEADRALHWYIHAALLGRFAGSTETYLAKDLETVDKSGIEGVTAALARSRKGVLSIDAQDFEGNGRGSRSYPLLYLLTRVRQSRDLVTGHPLGVDASALQVHEIFPKPELVKLGKYSRAELNAIANFAFVVPSTAVTLNRRNPAEYLAHVDPAVLASQWIPADPELWKLENYREFLAARRELLARDADAFSEELLTGSRPWTGGEELKPIVVAPDDDERDARVAQIKGLVEEFAEMGFAAPSLDAEISDPDTGRVLAVAEAFWADGLQPGQDKAVILELDPEEADLARLAELECLVFTSVDALRGYAQRRNETASGEREDDGSAVSSIGGSSAEVDIELLDEPPVETGGQFDQVVLDTIDACKADLGYNPKQFKVMVNQYGALGAVRRILHAPAVSDGFVTLWERRRLDLTVEAIATDERFRHLFTEEELAVAEKRLADFTDAVPKAG
ncbi:DUF262 domain-containing protein [Pseudonocardia benzenivorans]|uniref:DUF262 domain-containing protein n=1 Tax=Pseudonocardia benzenivorans TaxID=228005 RepID=A0ABW3VQ95_9PSEU